MSITDAPRQHEVWLEGYRDSGDEQKAVLIGGDTADSFRQAVANVIGLLGWDVFFFDANDLTYWGRRFFDNEQDARATFG